MQRPSLIESCIAVAPPPTFTVSEWADEYRILPQTSGAGASPWRTEDTPYLRGVMDAVHEPGVRKIAVRKGAQLGGSEALHNILGYFIAHDPCPMLFVHPTATVAEEWSKERLADMIRSTPALSDVVQEKRGGRGSADVESTLSLKMFPGGFLALGGANTPNTFARRSVRIAIGDDVDRFPAVVGEEGDPADLLVNRTTTFYDALAIFVSTPTLKGGRIDTLVERSDRRQFVVTCPGCGHEDWITWSDGAHFRVAFDDRDPETAALECPKCHERLDDIDRRAMVRAAGARDDKGWRPTAVAQESGLVGFHLPSMLSTLGNVSLAYLVEKWLSARARGKEALRVFVNTSLAEGWEDRGAKMEPHVLLQRRERYDDRPGVEIPREAVAITAGVDVQENRFEMQVLAWGPSYERWVIDWRSVNGNPKSAEARAMLLDALNRRYTHALGHLIPIHAVCIDSGYATEDVYDFVLAHQARRVYATKGFAGRGGEPIVGKPSEKRYGKNPRPVRLYPINVDDAKAEIVGALALPKAGAGSMHFPLHVESVDEEYFAQLCAEHKETRYNKQGVATHTIWVQDRERNEALDTAVLALAAYRLLNPNIRQMQLQLAAIPPTIALDATNVTAGPAPELEATLVTPPPVMAARRRERRHSHSLYLEGR